MQDIKSMTGYIRTELDRHVPEANIVRDLTIGGWQTEQINKIIADIKIERAKLDAKSVHKRDLQALRHLFSVVCVGVIGLLAIAYVMGGE